MTLPPNPGKPPLLMTYDDVAAALGVHKNTVRKMVLMGTIPKPIAFTPKTIRFVTKEINEFLRNKWQKPPSAGEEEPCNNSASPAPSS